MVYKIPMMGKKTLAAPAILLATLCLVYGCGDTSRKAVVTNIQSTVVKEIESFEAMTSIDDKNAFIAGRGPVIQRELADCDQATKQRWMDDVKAARAAGATAEPGGRTKGAGGQRSMGYMDPMGMGPRPGMIPGGGGMGGMMGGGPGGPSGGPAGPSGRARPDR